MGLKSKLGGWGLYLYSQIVRRTARYEVHGREKLTALGQDGRPVIWTSWHGVTMMLSGLFLHRIAGQTLSTLFIIPDDWRGEMLAEWVRLVGARSFAVSMQENSLVAARRFLELIRELESGGIAYINPDGPAGPAGVPKPGVSFLASRSGATILPLGLYTRTGYRLPRWDRYVIPFPFSRIVLVVGEPVTVARRADIDAAGKQLAQAINLVMARAQERY